MIHLPTTAKSRASVYTELQFSKKPLILFESETPTCRFVETKSFLFLRIATPTKPFALALLPRPWRRPCVDACRRFEGPPMDIDVDIPFPFPNELSNDQPKRALEAAAARFTNLGAALCRRPSFHRGAWSVVKACSCGQHL